MEHDKDIMKEADLIIDIGPGAGKLGGEIVAKNKPEKLNSDNSLTGKFLVQKPIKKTSKKISLKNTIKLKKLLVII